MKKPGPGPGCRVQVPFGWFPVPISMKNRSHQKNRTAKVRLKVSSYSFFMILISNGMRVVYRGIHTHEGYSEHSFSGQLPVPETLRIQLYFA